MKIYEQIPFDFNDNIPPQDMQPAIGIRIKTLKQPVVADEPIPMPEPPQETTVEATVTVPVMDTAPEQESVPEPEEWEQTEAEDSMEDIEKAPIEEEITPEQPALLSPPQHAHTGAARAITRKSGRGRKSLKEMEASVDLVNIPPDEVLFQRQYYAIGEVADMFGVNQSLLRFWENEFDILQPRKNRKGDRHFRPVDIKNLELIYDLLRRRKLTIEGAKDFLKQNKMARERFELIQSLQSIRGFLLEIKAKL